MQSEVSGTLISSVFLEYGSVIRSNDGAFGDPITYGLVNQLTIIDEFWTQLGIRPPQSATDIKNIGGDKQLNIQRTKRTRIAMD